MSYIVMRFIRGAIFSLDYLGVDAEKGDKYTPKRR